MACSLAQRFAIAPSYDDQAEMMMAVTLAARPGGLRVVAMARGILHFLDHVVCDLHRYDLQGLRPIGSTGFWISVGPRDGEPIHPPGHPRDWLAFDLTSWMRFAAGIYRVVLFQVRPDPPPQRSRRRPCVVVGLLHRLPSRRPR